MQDSLNEQHHINVKYFKDYPALWLFVIVVVAGSIIFPIITYLCFTTYDCERYLAGSAFIVSCVFAIISLLFILPYTLGCFLNCCYRVARPPGVYGPFNC